jgi:hypothetical protein
MTTEKVLTILSVVVTIIFLFTLGALILDGNRWIIAAIIWGMNVGLVNVLRILVSK